MRGFSSQFGEGRFFHEPTRISDGGARAVPAQHDVAGQHERDRRIELQGPMGQRRVARAEDLEGRTDDPELRLEGSGHIDLGEDAEALGSQRRAHRDLGALDGLVDDGVERTHQYSPELDARPRAASI